VKAEEVIAALNAHPRLSKARISKDVWILGDKVDTCSIVIVTIAKGEGPNWKDNLRMWQVMDDILLEDNPAGLGQMIVDSADAIVEEGLVDDFTVRPNIEV